MTAIGKITLARSYRSCPNCREGGFPADTALGVDGSFTRLTRRRICRVGVEDSFERGARTLQELAGWSVDAETIRRLCHAEAARNQARIEHPEITTRFAKASGHRELQIDAGKVNTLTGWRDVKVAAFAVRPAAAACVAAEHDRRELPRPTTRRVIAAIETAEDLGARCLRQAKRMGLADDAKLTILGDGAEWIWRLAEERFPHAAQALDVYHASEYLADLARAGFGGDTAAVTAWTRRAQVALVADGWTGVCQFVAATVHEVSDRGALEAAYPRVANYLCGHQDRMRYAARLRRGQAIGSGLIEGTIKQLVGRRLKQTGARWRSEHVGPLVELLGLAQTGQTGE